MVIKLKTEMRNFSDRRFADGLLLVFYDTHRYTTYTLNIGQFVWTRCKHIDTPHYYPWC